MQTIPPTPAFILISGPCVIESEALCMQVAESVLATSRKLRWQYIFKASYDKANRTSLGSKRGPGLNEGLRILQKIKKKFNIPVLTDIHSPEEAAAAAQVCDVLQIPAFLCRQTDLILAAARTGRTVNVKKGQFLAPWDVNPIVEKLRSGGCGQYYITERGTTFGYNNLVVDMRSLAWMKKDGHTVIFDATHSVQRPGGLGAATGGDSELAPVLARAAVAVGIDGLFIETHPDPAHAWSDGPNQIPLHQLASELERIERVRLAAGSDT